MDDGNAAMPSCHLRGTPAGCGGRNLAGCFKPARKRRLTLAGGVIYSITLSARSTSPAGISCPMAFAVLRLTTSSKFDGCSTGTSAGLAPQHLGDLPRALAIHLRERRAIADQPTQIPRLRPLIDPPQRNPCHVLKDYVAADGLERPLQKNNFLGPLRPLRVE